MNMVLSFSPTSSRQTKHSFGAEKHQTFSDHLGGLDNPRHRARAEFLGDRIVLEPPTVVPVPSFFRFPRPRYKAIKYLAREFCIFHQKGACMTHLMKDLQAMNKFKDMEVALKSIQAVICRVLECDCARVWTINAGAKTAWTMMATKKSEAKTITKSLDDGTFVSRAFDRVVAG